MPTDRQLKKPFKFRNLDKAPKTDGIHLIPISKKIWSRNYTKVTTVPSAGGKLWYGKLIFRTTKWVFQKSSNTCLLAPRLAKKLHNNFRLRIRLSKNRSTRLRQDSVLSKLCSCSSKVNVTDTTVCRLVVFNLNTKVVNCRR